jgi:hypothetical protein
VMAIPSAKIYGSRAYVACLTIAHVISQGDVPALGRDRNRVRGENARPLVSCARRRSEALGPHGNELPKYFNHGV